MERALVLEAEGLNEPYKLLTEYKDVVLCGRQYGNGMTQLRVKKK